ncbi:hypothetical protein GGR50DRAFT_329658 [Xylaria sp. CBS 124048]|nr:hypothetical protein GGR50DRAFT_329658 [Xylaria sp. CBS 124048]
MHPSKSTSSHQHKPSGRENHEGDSNGNVQGTQLKPNFSVRDVFRNITSQHSPTSSSEPIRLSHKSSSRNPPSRSMSHTTPNTPSQNHRGRPVIRQLPRSGLAKPESAPPAPNRGPSDGTRGYFVPPYQPAEHYALSRRRNNPTHSLPLPLTHEQRSDDPSCVVVGFYHCQHYNFGREYLATPDVQRLLSASVAFLGECQLNDIPQDSRPKNPNAGYRGLSLEGLHGYHIHFPDYAGSRPFSSSISADWERVKCIHKHDAQGTVLLVGVGLGKPGIQCCETIVSV